MERIFKHKFTNGVQRPFQKTGRHRKAKRVGQINTTKNEEHV